MPPPAASKWTCVEEGPGTRESRIKRTATVTCPIAGKPYDRSDFRSRVDAIVGLSQLEALGPMSQAHVWQLTFGNEAAKEKFTLAGDFEIKPGHMASVGSNYKRRHYVRVHWVPYPIPMQAIVSEFEKINGLTVISANYTKSTVPGMTHVRSLLREIVVEAESVHTIPHVINWRAAPAGGQALVTVRGRPGACLKCFREGHHRSECPVRYCQSCRQQTSTHTAETCPGRSFATAVSGTSSSEPIDHDLVAEDAADTGHTPMPVQPPATAPAPPAATAATDAAHAATGPPSACMAPTISEKRNQAAGSPTRPASEETGDGVSSPGQPTGDEPQSAEPEGGAAGGMDSATECTSTLKLSWASEASLPSTGGMSSSFDTKELTIPNSAYQHTSSALNDLDMSSEDDGSIIDELMASISMPAEDEKLDAIRELARTSRVTKKVPAKSVIALRRGVASTAEFRKFTAGVDATHLSRKKEARRERRRKAHTAVVATGDASSVSSVEI